MKGRLRAKSGGNCNTTNQTYIIPRSRTRADQIINRSPSHNFASFLCYAVELCAPALASTHRTARNSSDYVTTSHPKKRMGFGTLEFPMVPKGARSRAKLAAVESTHALLVDTEVQ